MFSDPVPLVSAALNRAIADELAALAPLQRGEPVPTLVLRELSAQLSDQLRSLGFGPANEPRPRIFGIDRPVLPPDLACILIQKLLEFLDQLGQSELQTRGKVTAAIVAFAQHVIGDFLAADARREAVSVKEVVAWVL
jgi:hypothetical protein